MGDSVQLEAFSSQLTIHTDGGARGNPGLAATGIAVFDAHGLPVHAFGRCLGTTTNNVAEYTAVIDALQWLVGQYKSPIPAVSFKLDSNLVVQQLNRKFQIKQPHLLNLATQVWSLISTHHISVSFEYVPRAQNKAADTQVNLALDAAMQ